MEVDLLCVEAGVVVITLALVAAMAVPAFAADDPSTTVGGKLA